MKKLYLIGMLFFCLLGVQAQISGTITENTTWSGNVLINGEVILKDGVILTIMPGTTIKFDGWHAIQSHRTARIQARGTKAQPIVFTSADTTGFVNDFADSDSTGAWRGIRMDTLVASEDSIIFEHCHFQFAKVTGAAGTRTYGGILYFGTRESRIYRVKIDNCTFRNGLARWHGGAVYLYRAEFSLSKNSFYDCKGYYGGGIYASASYVDVVNSLFVGNYAYWGGGGLYKNSGMTNIVNCTFVDNQAANYGASAYFVFGDAYAYNSIFRGDFQSQLYMSVDKYAIFNNNIEHYDTLSSFYINCINQDPLFTDAAIGDYSLQAGSPCINAGDTLGIGHLLSTSDLAGDKRFHQSYIDMGVYEYQQDVSASVTGRAIYPDGTPLANFEICSGIQTDANGEFSLQTGSNGLNSGDQVNFNAPEGYGIYPSFTKMNMDKNINLKLYHGIVVDRAFKKTSTINWDADTIQVFSNVVLEHSTLNISAGTYVQFHNWATINVLGKGNIVAKGTKEKPIVFTPADTSGYDPPSLSLEGAWGGLRFLDMDSEEDSTILTHCVFEYSKNTRWGGALEYTGIRSTNKDKTLFANCVFRNNSSRGGGGALYLSDATVEFRHCSFIDNWCRDVGGALYSQSSGQVKFINCDFRGNEAKRSGGALFMTYSKSAFINCNIVENKSDKYGVSLGTTRGGKFINTIIWGNTGESEEGDLFLWNTEQIEFYNCLIPGGDTLGIRTYKHCMGGNPSFADPANEDYSLRVNSPCINSGTLVGLDELLPKLDLAGNNRVFQHLVDIGCYEAQEPIQASINGTLKYEVGDPVQHFELFPGVATDANGNFEFKTDGSSLETGQLIEFYVPKGYGIYPSQWTIRNQDTLQLTAYKGIVVDKPYDQKTIIWNADTVNVFIDLHFVDQTLEIAPGTKVKYYDWLGMSFKGASSIHAQGSQISPIHFTVADTTGFDFNSNTISGAWKGISILELNSKADTSFIQHCVFEYAKTPRETENFNGGALGVFGNDTEARNYAVISNSVFKNNYAYYGGAVFLREMSFLFENNYFINNHGRYGGGLYLNNSPSYVLNSTFTRNQASSGGAIYSYNYLGYLVGCQIDSNSAEYDGGGFYCYNRNDVNHFANCNFIDNQAGRSGSAIYGYWEGATFRNNIVRGNEIFSYNGIVNAFNCNIEGGNYFGASSYLDCIDADPVFKDAAKRDFALKANSPCINTGTTGGLNGVLPASDLAGSTRVWNNAVDIGAYEFIPENEQTRHINLSGNLSFGEVEIGAEKSSKLVVTNIGNSPLSIESANSPQGFNLRFDGIKIPAGSTNRIPVTFEPTEEKAYSGTIELIGNQTQGDNTVSVSGTGINVPVTADFIVDKNAGQAPLKVTFTDASQGTPTSWSWDFDGDGTEDSNQQHPSFIYAYGGTYSVRLTVSDGSSSNTKLIESMIIVEGGASLESDWEEDLLYYPNPATDEMIVQSPVPVKCSIMTITGALVKQSSIFDYQARFNVSSLNPGMYFLKIDSQEGSLVKQIIINR